MTNPAGSIGRIHYKGRQENRGDVSAWICTPFRIHIDYIHELPKPEDATEAQTTYIKGEFFKLESAAARITPQW
jgi:hypothetical protein